MNPKPFEDYRKIEELNEDNLADVFPWISPDGLRLYYTACKGEGSKLDSIFMAQYNQTTKKFENPLPVSVNKTSKGNRYGWLSNDEKEIYFVNNNPQQGYLLHYAWRNSLAEEFSEAEVVTDLIHAPTNNGISIFGNEAYVYCSSSSNKMIVVFAVADSTNLGNNHFDHKIFFIKHGMTGNQDSPSFEMYNLLGRKIIFPQNLQNRKNPNSQGLFIGKNDERIFILLNLHN